MSSLSGGGQLPGFAQPVHDAQRVFRGVLEALGRPTLPRPLPRVVAPPAPLSQAVGGILLALCDDQTPVWLDKALRASTDVVSWLRFHTGARIVDDARDALFVVASSPSAAPRLSDLAQGTDEEPHRSATLVIDATGARGVGSFTATGPGINGSARWDGAGLPGGFLGQWMQNHERFPRGVDVVLAASDAHGDIVRGLPRSTRLEGAENKTHDRRVN
ncbi:phosphonate C-P lyase system protein PhnH [Microbacterium stercoris]|uniref:Phosphonate C-P lyase system protein PhnH n=1 Tax=Microbacterium stercoris TaxID=2820289 RepID=A0A939QKK9_9MICO|nr:phosphonate C-P lyase system protein PhnH [Microbacterium stercoris]MBO3664653.1 phosphonate C-P lyase system protein PhnH [Microbacterium stercoris]